MNYPKPNKGKKLTITVDGKRYMRFPIHTHIISEKDSLSKIISFYVVPLLKKDDVVVISERIVAITQGRSYPIDKINPSILARILSFFVTKHPGGIGLKSPWTMELAIREAGLCRILLGSLVAAFTKPFGIRGLFYKVVGKNINAIDGPCSYTLPPGDKQAKLGPKQPERVVDSLRKTFNHTFVIIDANDYGVNILASSPQIDNNLFRKIFSDNPLGQSREQTPIAIVRAI